MTERNMMTDDLRKRVERLERHVGVSKTQLEWEDYVDEFLYLEPDDEIVDTAGHQDRPTVVLLSECLRRKGDLKQHFEGLIVNPHDEERVKITAIGPDNWREKLRKREDRD